MALICWIRAKAQAMKRDPEQVSSDQQDPDPTSKISLLPLTPSYDETSHRIYVSAIDDALDSKDEPGIRNIALTGSYGVGKSSILQKVAKERHDEVVLISLSTLGVSDEGDPSGATSTTNRIQKEIVKQLLYREDPNKTPGSRFRRISGFHVWRAIAIAITTALVLAMVFFLTGWTDKLANALKPHLNVGLWIYVLLIPIFTVFVYTLEFLAHNRLRIQIQSLQTGPATIALANGDAGVTSYFDQYLDEIVYSFEVTRRTIVIFEDIDRFNHPHIFDTLRALNTLLNRAQQLDGRPIRFIYAIRDSMFDELGNAELRSISNPIDRGANRTKFFDLVIPVVPFITHRSSRDLMKTLMKDVDRRISSELIDLASQHITDMRLIKNIRNEFVIFRDHLLPTTKQPDDRLNLNATSLFAMVIYKNFHLTDFERIKSRTSKLDVLYDDSRAIVNENTSRLKGESVETNHRLDMLDSVTARSERLGSAFIDFLKQFGAHTLGRPFEPGSIDIAGKNWANDGLRSPEFWQFVSARNPDSPIQMTAHDSRQGWNVPLHLSPTSLSNIVRGSLSRADWEETERADLEQQRQTIVEKIEFLSRTDMKQLIPEEGYKLGEESFRQRTAKLDSELAQLLVIHGYIDENYTLYTALFYGESVSARAQNFLIHNVSRNVMDPTFDLKPDDVDAILQERGDAILDDKAMYNIAVLDHLLSQNNARTDRIVQSLAAFGPDEREFLIAYLPAGKEALPLVRRLTTVSDQILDVLSTTPEFDHLRIQLLNEAISSIDPNINCMVSDGLRQFIEQNAAAMPIFTDPIDPMRARAIVSLIVSMNAQFASLGPLGPEIRKAVVAENRYAITRENLMLALNGSEALALDQVFDANKTVYAYAIGRLPEYLAALGEDAQPGAAIASKKLFLKIISDVSQEQSNLLPEVLALAVAECRVQNLADVPESAWVALATAQRIPATFANVTDYINVQGGIDQPLAELLHSVGSIQESGAAPEEKKEQLAYMLLSAQDVLSDAGVRVNLVSSLELGNDLDPSKIEPQKGHFTGLLIQEKVIEDIAEWFQLVSSLNWESREFAISQSDNFHAFVTPTQVPPRDIPPLMQSPIISDAVKIVIVQQVDAFVPDNDQLALEAVASYAVENQVSVPIGTVEQFAHGLVSAQLVVELLEPHLPQLTEEQLVPLLKTLGEPYELAAERNGRHPKFPRTTADLALIRKLEDLNIVNSSTPKDDSITVHMKKSD